MTQTLESRPSASSSPPGKPFAGGMRPQHADRSRSRRARAATVAVLVVALLVASFARQGAIAMQESAARSGPYSGKSSRTAGAGASLGNMNSFFLALLLGGLRGPLVMFLWATSESQKNERQLEDFDTKVELIRLLQPEFDTVHIYQIWNKAYNVSVQLASLPNRYAAILDALDYARDVDEAKPNDINIVMAISQLFSHKLSTTSGDSVYYIKKVREDSKWRVASGEKSRPGAPRQHMEPVLDPAGNLLPAYTRTTNAAPSRLAAKVFVPADQAAGFSRALADAGAGAPTAELIPATGEQVFSLDEPIARKVQGIFHPDGVRYQYADWISGAELQYLEPFQPFPYGLPPQALGYNYSKRSQVLMTLGKQKPLQLSEGVVDSRPALELQKWAETEWENGAAAELRAFGQAVPPTRQAMELPTIGVTPDDKPADPAAYAEALYSYRLSSRLSAAARAEYHRHMSNAENFVNRFNDYGSQIDTASAEEALTSGDADFLTALSQPAGAGRETALRSAAAQYRQAVAWYQYLDLRYYVPSQVADAIYSKEAPGTTRENLASLLKQPERLNAVYTHVLQTLDAMAARNGNADPNASDRQEYFPYQARARQRQAVIARLLGESTPMPRPATTGPSVEPSGAAGK